MVKNNWIRSVWLQTVTCHLGAENFISMDLFVRFLLYYFPSCKPSGPQVHFGPFWFIFADFLCIKPSLLHVRGLVFPALQVSFRRSKKYKSAGIPKTRKNDAMKIYKSSVQSLKDVTEDTAEMSETKLWYSLRVKRFISWILCFFPLTLYICP